MQSRTDAADRAGACPARLVAVDRAERSEATSIGSASVGVDAGGGAASAGLAYREELVSGICALCDEDVERSCLTPCQHVFCEACIRAAFVDQANAGLPTVCPSCSAAIDTEKLFARAKGGESDRDDDDAMRDSHRISSDCSGTFPGERSRAEHSGTFPGERSRAEHSLESAQSSPPSDGVPVVSVDTHKAATDVAAAMDVGTIRDQFGSKLARLVALLREMVTREPGTQAVVFSTWGRVLRLAERALDACAIAHCALGGGRRGETALRRFRAEPSLTVLFVPLRRAAGATGLTLTNAHHAFMLEASLASALEDQAVGRLWRIGQQHRVRVLRIVSEGTVERGILALQERRKRRGESRAATRAEKETERLRHVAGIFAMDERCAT